jgi:transposase-like protein
MISVRGDHCDYLPQVSKTWLRHCSHLYCHLVFPGYRRRRTITQRPIQNVNRVVSKVFVELWIAIFWDVTPVTSSPTCCTTRKL